MQTNEPPPTFRIVFGFFDGQAREPTLAEVESLICETNLYFQNRLQQSTGDYSLMAYAQHIDWVFSPDCPGPVTVTFELVGIFGDGQQVPSNYIFQTLKLGDEDMRDYLQNYVWESPPVGTNVFSSTNTMTLEDMLGEQIPVPGQLAQAVCGSQSSSMQSGKSKSEQAGFFHWN